MQTLASRIGLLASLLAAPALAQDVAPVLANGAVIDGQTVVGFLGVTIDDDGSWATTTLSDGPLMLVRDGAKLLRVGESIASPAATVLGLLAPVGGGSRPAFVARLAIATGPSPALVRDGAAILATNNPLDVVGLPPGTLAGEIRGIAADEDGTVVAVVGLGAGDEALLRFDFAPDGTPLGRTLALRVGDPVPGLPGGATVADLARPALNERGDWMIRATSSAGGTHLLVNGASVAASGGPSPVPGRPYAAVLRSYDLNDLGGVAFVARLAGDPSDDLVLVENGVVIAREGDLVPSVGTLADFGQVRLASSGDTYWHAVPAGGDLSVGAILREDQPVLAVGTSIVAGELVTAFEDATDSFDVSPSGRFLVARVVLETSGRALVVADLGASRPIPGCTPNPATLRHTDGLVVAGSTIDLTLDGPAPLGAPARVTFALGTAPAGDGCGLPTPFGEIFLHPGSVVGSLPAGVFAGSPLTLGVAIPPSAALVDVELVAQGAFLTGGAPLLTNGLALEIGAP